MLHIAQVSGYVDPHRRAPDALLEAWPSVHIVAAATARAGNRVTVVQAAAADAVLERDGVTYRFVRASNTRASVRPIAAAVRALHPDVVHLRGLVFPLHAWSLRRGLPHTPLLLQDHAARPPRGWRAHATRHLLRSVDGVAFTNAAQAQPFLRSQLLRADQIFEVPASTSVFTPGEADALDDVAAQLRRRYPGSPCIVWVGRLAAVKDPFTALAAFARVRERLPDARLYCAFGEAPLEREVRACIEAHATLRGAVTLLGTLPHAEVEQLLRAADIFVASSRSESTGFALLEAMACGATPVVSDIPAFRTLTRNAAVGALFPPGDAAAAADAMINAASTLDRARVRAHFDACCGPDALGKQLTELYRVLMQRAHVGAEHGNTERADTQLSQVTDTRSRKREPERRQLAGSAKSRRLRVCVLVPGGVDRSGTERVIPCLLALIERLAHDVDLHVLALRQEAVASRYELLGATAECVPRSNRTERLAAIRRAHRDARFDVLHAIWMSPQGTTAALAGRLLRVPVLLHLNGGDLSDLRDIEFGGRATAAGRTRLRIAVAGAAHITAPSLAMCDAARALGIATERLTYGVDVQRWPVAAPRARDPREPARLLSVGGINRVKDHHTLLHAVAELRRRGHDVRLECAGVDTLAGAAQQEARALGISDIVQFTGFVPHAELRRCYEAANVLVVSSRHEGDPIAALEAALAGVAVVGTDVGHLREWAPDAARTCKPADAAALADVIEAVLADDALRMRLACRAQQHALTHSADAGAARVLKIYQQLAAR